MTGIGLSSILVFKCIIVVTPGHAYYQKDYDGYLFTIPGFNDVERRSQSNAATWCNQNRSKLIEVTNSKIQTALVMFAREAIAQNQLTGNNIITNGKRNSDTWRWVNEYGFSGPSISGQSDGYVISYGYLNTNPTGFTYVADRVIENKGYICEGQSFCGNGYSINNRCYKSFNGEILTWYGARNRCLEGGGDLASFEFIQNDQQLNNLNGSWLSLSKAYWIGLRREFWKWQSSSLDVKYSNWSDGHPVYDQYKECLCLLPNTPIFDWKWSECNCNDVYQFVCMSALPGSASTTATSKSYASTSETHLLSVIPSDAITLREKITNVGSTLASSGSTQSSSPMKTGGSNGSDEALAIGLGVGLGGAFLIVAASVVIYFLIRRRNGLRSSQRRKQLVPPDVITLQPTTDSTYAEIQRQPGNEDSSPPDSQDFGFRSPVEYAPLTIVTGVTTTRDMNGNSNSSLRHAKTTTLAPPDLHNLPSPSASNDKDMYGKINK